MKKSQEIIGLPVFSILDGRKIGQVKDLVLNPEEGKLDFILVSNGSWYVGARVLPYRAISGIGEHAVTTESEAMLSNINETLDASNLLERNIEIKGNRVLTNRGNLIGVISEYEIDENTGRITRIEYKTAQDESKVEGITADRILTYGADVVVVREGQDSPSPAPAAAEPTPPTTADDQPLESEGAALFKQRQRQFMLGKTVVQDIRNGGDNPIITQGTVVTEEIIDLAEQHNKFVELSQCVK
jgi:uncharacterized protein YrrD